MTAVLLYFIGILFFVYLGLRLLSKIYADNLLEFFMKNVHCELRPLKRDLFEKAAQDLETEAHKNSAPLEILEIGVGAGQNFEFYPRNARLTILDKTNAYKSFYEQSISSMKRTDLQISDFILNEAENMFSIRSNSKDLVVHTFTLCSMNRLESVLAEIYRVLKPGGVCIFVEHAADLSSKMRFFVQKIMQPFFGECKYLDIKSILNEYKMYDKLFIREHYMSKWFLYTENPVVYGYGKKRP